jgi:hypothetical protein
MAGTEIRNDDGTFAAGNVSNPEGKNGHSSGWQKYGTRAIELANRYTTEQILEFANDKDKRNKELSYWDAMCVVHMARAIDSGLTQTQSGADHVNKEREALISRIEGTPKQTLDITSRAMPKISNDATPEEMAEAMAAIRSQG